MIFGSVPTKFRFVFLRFVFIYRFHDPAVRSGSCLSIRVGSWAHCIQYICLYQCYIYLLCFVFWGLVSLVVKYRGWNYRWRLSAIFTETMILPCSDILWGNLPPDDLPWVGGWNCLEDDFPKNWKAIPGFRIMQYPTSHYIPITVNHQVHWLNWNPWHG